MRKAVRACAAAVLLAAATNCTPARPANAPSHAPLGIGRPLDEAALRSIDIDVAPDGGGLPAGGGDPQTGARLFAQSCARCHGQSVGLGHDRWLYATSLFDYVRRAMPPPPAPRLTNEQTYALTAYLLATNGVISSTTALDRTQLPRVNMPDAADFELP